MQSLPFNPLNGLELKKIILDKMATAMDQSGVFRQARTFPWVHYNVALGLTVAPQQNQEDPPTIIAKVDGEFQSFEEIEQDGKKVVLVIPAPNVPTLETVTLDAVIDTPDLARLETNQPIPTQTVSETGISVDRPTMPKPPEVKTTVIRPSNTPQVSQATRPVAPPVATGGKK